MNSLQAEDADGNEVEAIKPLPWYPDNLAWQSNFSRNQLRKNQILERFHDFLKLENEIGNITRQEAVSMVPPLFLDVRPDHFVLDMCAAPGSKTFQLLEMIYKLIDPGTLPSGMVIANDLDVQRCNLLIHQTKRMCTANLVVTNHEAQHFPSCHLHRNRAGDSQSGYIKESGIRQLQFDRVLCDVPCSGDGTLRKAPDIWRKWNAGMGNGLHGLQVQIAMRGAALLKVGGRMVYSTCSMNPVENEAVVAEVLRRSGGALELINVSSELPQLARRPGLKKWKVRDKGLWLASYKDVPKYRRSVLTPGMFPSGEPGAETPDPEIKQSSEQLHEDGTDNAENEPQLMDDSATTMDNLEAEVSDLPLEHCMRIVSHDQNSGAFFIAVFHKITSLPASAASVKKFTGVTKATDSGSPQPQIPKTEMKDALNGDEIGEENVNAGETPNGNSLDTEMDEAPLEADKNKIDDENAKEETEPPTEAKVVDATKIAAGKRKLQIQGRWRGVDPVIFYKEDAVVNGIMEFYGIKESFPFKGHLITRNNDMNHVKRIYYVSDSVKEVLELNFLAGQQLKIASVGLKMFERQTSKEGSNAPCIFRISSEGLPLILPHMTKQILHSSVVDFKHLLQYKTIKFQDFVDPEFGKKASELMLGCCVVVLKKEGQTSSDALPPLAINCWRGRTNVSVMVTAIDCQELLERVTAPLSTDTDEPSKGEAEAEADSSIAEGGVDHGKMKDSEDGSRSNARETATLV
ncbi:uncharacterized protein LOC127258243 isoform X2 [Andrographis paniculata]|nr:uncharacterized protein LOC127258243 isoform X2 [Andrographis paniculata]